MQKENKKKGKGKHLFLKGESGNPAGRAPGVKNKTTQWLVAALMGPFDIDEFRKWQKANPTEYYTKIVSKFIPRDVNIGGELKMTHKLAALKAEIESNGNRLLPCAADQEIQDIVCEPENEE